MTTPANPLDKYVTYTYHFELHASHSWDKLRLVMNADPSDKATNRKTTGDDINNTLLINTRMDGHTTIDNVNFSLLSNQGGVTPMVAASEVTMTITEPGGVFFAEKLRNHGVKLRVRNVVSGLMFLLKIIFVGRKEDNSIETVQVSSIPMLLLWMTAQFDLKGGEYHPKFVAAATSLQGKSLLADAYGKINKSISFYAGTVQEAFKELEKRLNENYEKTYATEVENCPKAKPLQYVINVDDSRIDGKIDIVTASSTAPSAKFSFSWDPETSILDMIRQILDKSPDINKLIGNSNDNVLKQYQPGVKLISITPSYYPGDYATKVIYYVRLYEGEGKTTPENTYEFNYLFSGAGQNNDVLCFEMQFASLILWLQLSTSYGTQLSANTSASIPDDWKPFITRNVVTPDVTQKKLEGIPIQKKCIIADINDVAGLPFSVPENQMLHYTPKSLPAARLAFNTISQINGATNMQTAFTIRGHPKLLSDSLGFPDGKQLNFGATRQLWVKVNIFDQDGEPFFYTGAYRLMSIQNIFSGGKFTQVLHVIMCEDGSATTSATANTSATKETPTSNLLSSTPPMPGLSSVVDTPPSGFGSNAGGAATGQAGTGSYRRRNAPTPTPASPRESTFTNIGEIQAP